MWMGDGMWKWMIACMEVGMCKWVMVGGGGFDMRK